MDKTTQTAFFDSRDKYLSFVQATDEKVRIAFYLARVLQRWRAPKAAQPFYILDAGTGEGTVLATFLTAVHKRMPDTPVVALGKEISIDDICILLSYLSDRFAEHKRLVVHLTNLSYSELAAPGKVRYTRVCKAINGKTSHDFGLQLMNMADFVKKHWQLDTDKHGRLIPRQKIVLTLYRKDQPQLKPLFARTRLLPRTYDFMIAAQPFRLRREPAQVARKVIAPLLSLLAVGGRMTLVYSSGRDFTQPLLRALYPAVQPYANGAPARLLAELERLPVFATVRARLDTLRYGFINLYLGRRYFSLGNILSLWKVVTYVGQISEAEENTSPFEAVMERKMRARLAKIKDLSFTNNVIVFSKSAVRRAGVKQIRK